MIDRRTLLGGLAAGWLCPMPAWAAPQHRGVALGLFASDPDWNYVALLDELRAMNAAQVLLVAPYYQDSVTCSTIGRRSGFSPSPRTVERTLAQARRRGFAVSLMPLVRLTRRTATEWRGVLQPRDVQAWFAAWSQIVWTMAELAAEYDAHRLIVGTEFASLESHVVPWSQLITGVRARFSGRLMYSANWDHYRQVPFWSLVDDVGITGYFRLCMPGIQPVSSEITAGWRQRFTTLDAFAASHNRPWMLTEVGWPALATAAAYPWDDTRDAPPDTALQARLWSAFLDAVQAHPQPPAFFAWNGFGPVSETDHGFGLRGRPAGRVVAERFARWASR